MKVIYIYEHVISDWALRQDSFKWRKIAEDMENKVEWNENEVDMCVTALQLVSNFAVPLTFCWIADVLNVMQISVRRFQLFKQCRQ